MDAALKIAIEFSREIRESVSKSQLAEINRRNAVSDLGCATHDFMDSNMQMAAAFERAMRLEFLPADDSEVPESDIRLWNAAWEIARAARFALD